MMPKPTMSMKTTSSSTQMRLKTEGEEDKCEPGIGDGAPYRGFMTAPAWYSAAGA